MTLRVGVVGAGIRGADHVSTLRRFVRGAQVTAVADVDRTRAEAAAADALAYDDAFALITDPDVDAVVVASHDSVHAEQVTAAVRVGKPVLCEKPLAPTLAESRRVLRDIGDTGAALLSLGFMRRFDPGYVALRQAIDDRTVGAPVLVHNVSRGVSSGPGATSESSITGSAVHEFDVMPWLLRSPVVEVTWSAPRCSSQVEGLQDPHGGQGAEHRRDVPQRPLGLRRAVRGGGRDGLGEPG
jgi:myo-inositol 2-dehydrogenase / D-chiro-inositol 1-dehydrogenase